MKLALLVPCYNAAEHLNNFVGDVKRLNPQFDEVIFYNDGSTDYTLNLLKNSGYRYLSSEVNKGPGFARNRLLEATTCDYVHFHDVDDPINDNYLKGVQFHSISAFAAILCNADWVDAYNHQLVCKWEYYNKQFEREGPAYLIRNPVGGINGLYNRNTLLAIGGFDESLKVWEDADLNLRLALNHESIIFTETSLVKSLRYTASASDNLDRIREYKYQFLTKHLNSNDVRIKHELIRQVNILFHEAVQNKSWDLYHKLIKLAEYYDFNIPLTSNQGLAAVRKLLGPKHFTQVKQLLLNKLVFKS